MKSEILKSGGKSNWGELIIKKLHQKHVNISEWNKTIE